MRRLGLDAAAAAVALQVVALVALVGLLRELYLALFLGGYAGAYAGVARVLSALAGVRIPGVEALPYQAPSVLAAACRQPLFAVLAGGGVLVVLLARREAAWCRVAGGGGFRALATVAAAALAWPVVTSPYNFVFGHGHDADRLILLLLALLVALHPGWVVPFLALLLLLSGELNHPLPSVSLTTAMLPLSVLLVVAAAVFLRSFDGRHGRLRFALFWVVHGGLALLLPPQTLPSWLVVALLAATAPALRRSLPAPVAEGSRAFVVVTLAAVASCYFVPGLEKLSISPRGIEWVTDHELADLLLYRWSLGWLTEIGEPAKALLLRATDAGGPLVLGVVLGAELAGAALLAHRRSAAALLALYAAIHLGIYALLGIFFWQWLAIDLVLLVIVLRGLDRSAFGRHALALSAPLVLLAPYWLEPPRIAWHDTPLSYRVEIEAVGASGAVYPIDRRFFAPYDGVLTGAGAFDLVDGPLLVFPQGTKDFALASAIAAAGPDGLAALRTAHGVDSSRPARASVLEALVRRRFERPEGHSPKGVDWWRRVPAPAVSQGTRGEIGPALPEPVVAVRLLLVEQYRQAGAMSTLEVHALRTVAIPPPMPPRRPVSPGR